MVAGKCKNPRSGINVEVLRLKVEFLEAIKKREVGDGRG